MICLVVWAVTAWIMFGEDAGARVMPGKLTHHHAAFVSDCGHCHNDEIDSFKGFLSGLAHSDLAIKEGRRCLECHELGSNAFLAHSMDRMVLEGRTNLKGNSGLVASQQAALLRVGLPMNEKGEIACAVCHREHGGVDKDLKTVADMACQSCHQDNDDHFPHNHPEFGNFPYAKKTNIIFDHASHQLKNFPDQETKFECSLCHESSPTGQMLVKSFQESCTSCHHHEEQILGVDKLKEGVAILTAFGLDIETLADNHLVIKKWPADGADFDEAPTALSWLLLEADDQYPQARNDRNSLDGVDLSDLSDADPSQLLAAFRLAGAFERLVVQIAKDPKLLMGYIAGDQPLSILSQRASRLVVQKAFASIASKWFGACTSNDSKADGEKWGGGGRWYVDAETMSLCYIPMTHDDALLARLHERALKSDAQALRAELNTDARCNKCHTSHEALSTMHWKARPRVAKHEFTRFNHRPHLIANQGQGCSTCHVIGKPSANSDRNASNPGHHVGSGFESMSRKDCSSCHGEDQGTNRCVDCHNYHIGYDLKADKGH
ncbi:MAG: hypothetical protein ACI97A_003663 [Planctomycetota bacterium]|jgi:hypothetical protein